MSTFNWKNLFQNIDFTTFIFKAMKINGVFNILHITVDFVFVQLLLRKSAFKIFQSKAIFWVRKSQPNFLTKENKGFKMKYEDILLMAVKLFILIPNNKSRIPARF